MITINGMSEVWGIFITKCKRIAFMRQLEEAVTIERMSRTNINNPNSKNPSNNQEEVTQNKKQQDLSRLVLS